MRMGKTRRANTKRRFVFADRGQGSSRLWRMGRWLTKNFDLSQVTARVYMRWAREHNQFDRPSL
jgi:hypothetical protein